MQHVVVFFITRVAGFERFSIVFVERMQVATWFNTLRCLKDRSGFAWLASFSGDDYVKINLYWFDSRLLWCSAACCILYATHWGVLYSSDGFERFSIVFCAENAILRRGSTQFGRLLSFIVWVPVVRAACSDFPYWSVKFHYINGSYFWHARMRGGWAGYVVLRATS